MRGYRVSLSSSNFLIEVCADVSPKASIRRGLSITRKRKVFVSYPHPLPQVQTNPRSVCNCTHGIIAAQCPLSILYTVYSVHMKLCTVVTLSFDICLASRRPFAFFPPLISLSITEVVAGLLRVQSIEKRAHGDAIYSPLRRQINMARFCAWIHSNR